MIRATVAAGMAVAAVCAAFGQSAATPLKFEVASIKPAAGSPDGLLRIRMRVGPGQLDYSSVSLKAMIQRACEVQDYQVSGPDWMASTRFDVTAKLPANTPGSRVPEMLRSLMADRFKLAVHRESKELPMYGLVVGKNGPKMKESEIDPNTPLRPDGGRGPGGPPGLDCGPRGESAVRTGWFVTSRPGHVQGHAMNMASLVNVLGALLRSPVVDQTGLKGNYDFDLEFTPDEAPPAPTVGGDGGVPFAGAPPDANGVSLFAAVQSQLGLKLETKKGPMELIVVDHIEKTPIGN